MVSVSCAESAVQKKIALRSFWKELKTSTIMDNDKAPLRALSSVLFRTPQHVISNIAFLRLLSGYSHVAN